MAEVSERIKKIAPYFKGMQVEESNGEQVIYVMVSFPPRWIIDESIKDKFDVSVADDGQVFYFCASLAQGFDVIFDAIDYNIEKMKTAQERAALFRQKTQELQNLFSDESITIESLRTLDFTYRGKKKKTIIPPKVTEEIKPEEEEEKVTCQQD